MHHYISMFHRRYHPAEYFTRDLPSSLKSDNSKYRFDSAKTGLFSISSQISSDFSMTYSSQVTTCIKEF
ncbi:AEH_G0017960.mRNA.1.CDS.1 [Saccharomyces cerevisiae]|nr:CNB_1a_G0017600.mRNA.1.CDS.1 [Saccharomyces cerevisiae]CAI4463035.1 AEH_G0017960.mRNA.1.CDS.1 [Saccharomyces cerevisiae]CAI5278434.1 CNT_HP2_G0018920.mRNA.1.CDS.1 [Saccharomyces cerevisiae]CAI6535505.1 CNT_HP1_G0016270.mRNA.1.CDS.1 [Saccharomyces cerevisiae]CAI6542637.1 CNT_HP2_G0018920.mRNA.1.CDS.1 [Saccharomyces cerevisiae]